MKVKIKSVDQESLAKLLSEAQVKLTDREAKMIDYCHGLSQTTWVGYNDEQLICAWGIVLPSLLSSEVYLWLHATGAIKTSQFLFVRHSQLFIQALLEDYDAVIGDVKVDAANSKRWLEWLGARFGPTRRGLTSFRIEKKWLIR